MQNWPQDFDGAIVLYPARNAAALDLQFGRITRELAKPGAHPNCAKRKARTTQNWLPAIKSMASRTV